MERRASLPRRVKHSETLDRLIRLRRDFAVVPFGTDSKKWESGAVKRRKAESEQEEHKRLIREADTSIKGINFPAEEMAKIIRSWMRQDDN
ncbi:MAG: hypothetical protein WCX65_16940 [bacterium]